MLGNGDLSNTVKPIGRDEERLRQFFLERVRMDPMLDGQNYIHMHYADMIGSAHRRRPARSRTDILLYDQQAVLLRERGPRERGDRRCRGALCFRATSRHRRLGARRAVPELPEPVPDECGSREAVVPCVSSSCARAAKRRSAPAHSRPRQVGVRLNVRLDGAEPPSPRRRPRLFGWSRFRRALEAAPPRPSHPAHARHQQCDDGASTGRSAFLGDALGPSDFRKNASRLALELGTARPARDLLDARLPDGLTASDALTMLRAAPARRAGRACPSRPRWPNRKAFDFNDCSVGNLVAGSFFCRMPSMTPSTITARLSRLDDRERVRRHQRPSWQSGGQGSPRQRRDRGAAGHSGFGHLPHRPAALGRRSPAGRWHRFSGRCLRTAP